MGPLQAQTESNIHAKSNMGAKCVWASSIVFDPRNESSQEQTREKRSNQYFFIAQVTLMCTYNVEEANFEQQLSFKVFKGIDTVKL